MTIRKIPKETNTFTFYNANPKNKRTTDCTIRAICTLLNKSWEDTLMDMTKFSIETGIMWHDTKAIDKYLTNKGLTKNKQPRKNDNTKYTGKEFCKMFKGKCVAKIGGHHIVFIGDGKIHDIWNSENGSIGNYWTL